MTADKLTRANSTGSPADLIRVGDSLLGRVAQFQEDMDRRFSTMEDKVDGLDGKLDSVCERLSAVEAVQPGIDKFGAERDLRYQQRFEAQNTAVSAALLGAEKAIAAALTAAEKAVIKAETATEKRFEGVNEFRQSLNDMATRQIPRAEYAAGMTNIIEKIDALGTSRDQAAGRSGLSVPLLIALAGFAGGIVVFLIEQVAT